MNHSTRILDCLPATEQPGSIILVPSAPPVMRSIEGMTVVVRDVLDMGDVLDKPKALYARAAACPGRLCSGCS